MPLHDGLAQSLPYHRLLPEPCEKEDCKKFIIDTRRETPLMKARKIAQRAKCTADHVRKILKAHQATERKPPPEGPKAGDGCVLGGSLSELLPWLPGQLRPWWLPIRVASVAAWAVCRRRPGPAVEAGGPPEYPSPT